MKYFMTDIHGDLDGMQALLGHVGPDWTRDRIVFGGDYIDRGKQSGGVAGAIRKLANDYPHNVVALIGNHEEMMRDYYRHADKLWLSHGGRETKMSFEKVFPHADRRHELVEWLSELPLLYEDEQFVYTHAGINPYLPLDRQERDILWMTEADFYRIPKETLLAATRNKTVVHGHTPVERMYFDGARLNCDLGSYTYSVIEERGLALVNLTEMIYWVYKQATRKIEQRRITRF